MPKCRFHKVCINKYLMRGLKGRCDCGVWDWWVIDVQRSNAFHPAAIGGDGRVVYVDYDYGFWLFGFGGGNTFSRFT